MDAETISQGGSASAAALPQRVFALAFEHSTLGMAIVSREGRVLHANEALCSMLGYSPSEIRHLGLRGLLHDEDLEADAASRRRLLARDDVVDRAELRYRHKRGRTVWALRTAFLADDEDGAPGFVVEQLQDLTERRRAEKEVVLLNNLLEQRIQRRTAELEGMNADLRDFAYSLAHDVRGPLASIDGFSSQLERLLQGQLDERGTHYLRRVRSGVRAMADLTDGLLALADLSRAELERVPVDLTELAAAILERLAESEPDRAVLVRVDATPAAMGDPRLLAVVMENLLGNAWKFSSRTSGAQITFGAERHEGELRYFVRDNGAGFDPAYAAKLFTPFQRLHAAAEFEGRGIGLAMVRKIIARHNGRIWAEAAPDRGACFWFTLPQT